jgi:hypothetical protein
VESDGDSMSASAVDAPLIVLKGNCGGTRVKVLLDSGAEKSFASTSFVASLAIVTYPSAVVHSVRMADGRINPVCRMIPNLKLWLGDWKCKLDLLVTDVDGYDIIVGKDWLSAYHPDVDWSTNVVKVRSLDDNSYLVLPLAATASSTPRVMLITAQQAARQIRTGERCFLAMMSASSDPADVMHHDDVPFEGAPKYVGGSPEFQNELYKMLDEYKDVAAEPVGLPPTRFGNDFSIKLQEGAQPAWGPIYKMSPLELQEVKKQLDDLLAKGWIRPSESAYGAPILFVCKKDGSLRICVDYRRLNAITVKNRTPLPCMDMLLDQLHGATYFTKLDLCQGYHQVKVAEEDVHKLAFRTRYGHFEFTDLPFGICTAANYFQKMMHKVLHPYIDRFVIVFLDDICLYSRSVAEHLSHLRTVLSKLREYSLHIKLTKCAFALPEIDFLGHVVSADGVKVDPKKTAALRDWPVPTTLYDVRAFLGLAGYYRKFVHRFAHLAAPLTELTKKASTESVVDRWGPAQQQAFEELKVALTEPPVLCCPDMSLPFSLYTDSYEFAHGATLLQDQGKGLQPVSYYSHKLTAAERKYGVGELELLAVVRAFKEFRPYLEGGEFSIFTDHHNLTHLRDANPSQQTMCTVDRIFSAIFC